MILNLNFYANTLQLANYFSGNVTISLSILSIIWSTLHTFYYLLISFYIRRKKFYLMKTSRHRFLNKIGEALSTTMSFTVFQIPSFVLTVTFSISCIIFTTNGDCHNKVLWRVGIFAVIFVWVNLIKIVSELPVIGEYALIFINIWKTFFFLSFFGILLILAFTMVLNMIFYNPQAIVSKKKLQILTY